MLLGALLDVGLPIEILEKELSKLNLSGYSIESQRAMRGVIGGTQVNIHQAKGTKSGYSIKDFVQIVGSSKLSTYVKDKATVILEKLGTAEELVHGPGHVLYELGEIDTVLDIVGVISGFEALSIEALYSSPLPCGWGIVNTKKGPLPIPAPATAQLIAMGNAKISPPTAAYLEAGELVTPTGAAIVTTLASFEAPTITVTRLGYGIGSKDIPQLPNVLSLWLGESYDVTKAKKLCLLETNIDDSTPELLGYVHEKLLSSGALDVWTTSIQMKKNRPGVMLSVLCDLNMEGIFSKIILEESSTLGVRVNYVDRYEAEREKTLVTTSLGAINVKVKRIDGNVFSISPEYEDCKVIAMTANIPLQEVFRRVEAEARNILGLYDK
jgi:uncharacterized protein (TIGR00299 family) protein